MLLYFNHANNITITMANNEHYIIESLSQIQAVSSPIRQEILDTVIAKRECSISDIALELGRPADGLYYHIRALLKEQLLIASGENKNNPRQETLYSPTKQASMLEVKYDQTDAEKIQAINKMVKSMLKITMEDFDHGLNAKGTVFEGESRELWAARIKSRLSQQQIKKTNQLLNQLMVVFKQENKSLSDKIYTLQWALAPIKAQPKRRK